MRIVVILLMLAVVSATGIGILASHTLHDGLQAAIGVAGGTGSSAAPAGQPPAPAAAPSGDQAAPAAARLPTPAAGSTAAEGDLVSFKVQEGETTASIAQRLADQGLVPNALLFRLWVQVKGAEGKLQAGDYQLRRGMSMDELIDALRAAKAKDVAVTFIEGQRLEEFAEALDRANTGIDAKRFLELAQHGTFTYDFLEDKPPSASLEGYLFPDTYRIIPGKTTPEELLHQMLKRFGDSVTPQIREQARKNGLTIYQLVTIASIVEREAQVKEERPRIAAVYENRLRAGECLCADPTVQYALGKPGNWWPVLQDQAAKLAPSSPYNTYTHGGLPPGPIANPGLASLKAAADPEKTDYMYFVRDDIANDGSHRFARTLVEHQANIAKYQRRP